MGVYSKTIRTWQRQITLIAGLCLLAPACSDPPPSATAESLGLPQIERPSAATPGATRAFLGAAAGTLSIAAANGKALESRAGTPLLADDRLVLGDDGLAVVIFTNGNVLRLEGPIDQELRALAGFDSPPVNDDLETQLVAALSDADRTRLSAENERIGGWQLRLTALEAPAPESAPEPRTSRNDEPPEPRSADTPVERMDDSAKLGVGGLPPGQSQRTTGKAKGAQGRMRPQGAPAKKPRAKEEDFERVLPPGITSKNAPGGAPSSPRKSADTPTLPWSLTGAKWTSSGSEVRIPKALRTKLVNCLPKPQGSASTSVDLVVESGRILKVTISGGLTCPQVIDTRIDGLSQSGTLRLQFKTTQAPS